MTHFPRPHRSRRAARIKLAKTVPAMLSLDGGERTHGNIQTLSLNGGLLQLAQALEAGDYVEISFQSERGPVRGTAEMLPPVQVSAETTLQGFRFVLLEDDDHEAIRSMVAPSPESDSPSGTT
jgi:PilZ domain